MSSACSALLLLAVALGTAAVQLPAAAAAAATNITKSDFPPGFLFGVGSSAYQVEGAAAEDGRKPSIWDTFTHEGKSPDQATADVTADQYHKYKEDVKLLKELGVDAYRFSIAWPRLIPDGRGAVNPKGLEYYNNLIDQLVSHGIQPHATIYNADLPQVLQDEYNGLISRRFIEDYTAYAEVCFENFGDRVKHWSTINQPNDEAIWGYDPGNFPPQRCSPPFGAVSCDGGNSTTEPYMVAHHLMLAHSSAVSLYRHKYQASQAGKIGLTLRGWRFEPATRAAEDVAAAERMNDFHIGWIMHPLVHGDYPPVMRKNVGSRLPCFSDEESKNMIGSFDFIGFNHYTVLYAKADLNKLNQKLRDYLGDAAAAYEETLPVPSSNQFNAAPMSSNSTSTAPVPWALRNLLEHLRVKYKNPAVIIHENGLPGGPSSDDDFRTQYLQDYIEATLQSIRHGSKNELTSRDGSNVQGYFVWSFLDVFEFLFGYRQSFGLYGVDFKSKEKTRYPRNSAKWFAGFLHGGDLRPVTLSGKACDQ